MRYNPGKLLTIFSIKTFNNKLQNFYLLGENKQKEKTEGI